MRRPHFTLIGFAAFALALSPLPVPAEVAGQPAAGAAGPISIEHFTKYQEASAIKISPDGEHFAVMAGK